MPLSIVLFLMMFICHWVYPSEHDGSAGTVVFIDGDDGGGGDDEDGNDNDVGVRLVVVVLTALVLLLVVVVVMVMMIYIALVPVAKSHKLNKQATVEYLGI